MGIKQKDYDKVFLRVVWSHYIFEVKISGISNLSSTFTEGHNFFWPPILTRQCSSPQIMPAEEEIIYSWGSYFSPLKYFPVPTAHAVEWQ